MKKIRVFPPTGSQTSQNHYFETEIIYVFDPEFAWLKRACKNKSEKFLVTVNELLVAICDEESPSVSGAIILSAEFDGICTGSLVADYTAYSADKKMKIISFVYVNAENDRFIAFSINSRNSYLKCQRNLGR